MVGNSYVHRTFLSLFGVSKTDLAASLALNTTLKSGPFRPCFWKGCRDSKPPNCFGVWSSMTGEKRLWRGSSSFGVVRPEAKGELVAVLPLYDDSPVKDGWFCLLSRLVYKMCQRLTSREMVDMVDGVSRRCSERRESRGRTGPKLRNLIGQSTPQDGNESLESARVVLYPQISLCGERHCAAIHAKECFSVRNPFSTHTFPVRIRCLSAPC